MMPWMASAAMALSSVSVVVSSLLLRYFKKPNMSQYEKEPKYRQWLLNRSSGIVVHRGIDDLTINRTKRTSLISSLRNSRLSQVVSQSISVIKSAVFDEKRKAAVFFSDERSSNRNKEEEIELQVTTSSWKRRTLFFLVAHLQALRGSTTYLHTECLTLIYHVFLRNKGLMGFHSMEHFQTDDMEENKIIICTIMLCGESIAASRSIRSNWNDASIGRSERPLTEPLGWCTMRKGEEANLFCVKLIKDTSILLFFSVSKIKATNEDVSKIEAKLCQRHDDVWVKRRGHCGLLVVDRCIYLYNSFFLLKQVWEAYNDKRGWK